MLESGNNFEETINNAMYILNEKITKIAMSFNSANVFSKNKDEEEILKKYQDISNDLKQGLDDLQNSAENYSAQLGVEEKMLKMLVKMLTEDSVAHRTWVANVREVVREENYSIASYVCTSVCISLIEPDIEAAINKYSTKLEKLKTMTERMIK